MLVSEQSKERQQNTTIEKVNKMLELTMIMSKVNGNQKPPPEPQKANVDLNDLI